MADISKIKTPDGTEYNIKSLRTSPNDLIPMQSKTYTNVIGTAASWVGASFAYGKITPDDFFQPWHIKVRVSAVAAGTDYSKAISEFTLDGVQDTYMTYSAQNAIQNTSYRPVYYHMYYRFKQAAITSGGCHYLGFSFLYSWSYTVAANVRTITIELLEMRNCSFEFLDTLATHSAVTAISNFSTYTALDFCSQGLQETGDANTSNTYSYYYYDNLTAGANKIFPYTLIMQNSDGRWESIVTSNSTGTSKTKNTHGFRPEKLLYFWSSGTINENARHGNAIATEFYSSLDARCSFNTGDTLTAHQKFYMVGTIVDGLFYLSDTWWSQSLPSTNDGKVYIEVGMAVSTTNISLHIRNPIYEYKDGAIHEIFVGDSSTVNGHTVDSDVPANAVFTDTTYESKAAVSGGTAVSLVTTDEKYTWNNKSTVPTNHASSATTYGTGTSANYGHLKLSDSTSSTSGASGGIAATPSAVKTAYDLANTANGTANSALSGVTGTLIYDHTYTISNGVATFAPHVYCQGAEVTTNYAKSCFSWKYRLIDGSEVALTTKNDRGCDVTISNMGYGGHVIGTFTPA